MPLADDDICRGPGLFDAFKVLFTQVAMYRHDDAAIMLGLDLYGHFHLSSASRHYHIATHIDMVMLTRRDDCTMSQQKMPHDADIPLIVASRLMYPRKPSFTRPDYHRLMAEY